MTVLKHRNIHREVDKEIKKYVLNERTSGDLSKTEISDMP